jgi:PAS domain S-box-containing protein
VLHRDVGSATRPIGTLLVICAEVGFFPEIGPGFSGLPEFVTTIILAALRSGMSLLPSISRPQLDLAGSEMSHRLAAIVRSSDDAIVSKTLDGIIQSWNPAAERLFGYTSEEAVGKSIRMIVPADRQGEEDEVLRRIRAGESVNHYETWRVRKDGTLVPVSLTVSPVHDARGQIVGASKIARDISERLELESLRGRMLEEERRARHEADTANRLKEEFLALVSHELRTPLNAILGWAQIASSAQFDVDTQAANRAMRRAIQVIERNAAAQARVVDDLLDISRVVSGKLELNTRPIELSSLIDTVVDSARPSAEARRLRLDVRHAERNLWINGDATRVQQVIWNLLSNAIKFTPAEGIVEIELQRTNQYARILVRDTGQGISPSFLPHVYDRFRQDDTSTTRGHSGLGIGLAVVKHLVEAHGGSVAAKSPGKDLGATFSILLPLLGPASVTAAERQSASDVLSGVRILVVDDEPDARELLFHLLSHKGAQTITAGSAGEAMTALVNDAYDVLLADLGMPIEDGFSLITAIRNHQSPHVRGVRAIAVTAYAGDDALRRALAAGFDGYIRKPIDFDRLVSYISGSRRAAHSGVVQNVQKQRAEA